MTAAESAAGDKSRGQNTMNLADSGRLLAFVLRTGKVQLDDIRYETDELILTIKAKITPESLREFAGNIDEFIAQGDHTCAAEKKDFIRNETALLTKPDVMKAIKPDSAVETKPESVIHSDKSFGKIKSRTHAPGVKPSAHIRYVCPKCKTPGAQPGDKVGSIVTCRRCGKAMRLTVKR